MPDMMPVKPAVADTIVRNPDRGQRPLKPDGELVPRSNFWTRRLRAGDVVEIDRDTWNKAAQARADAEAAAAKTKADAEAAAAKVDAQKADADGKAKPVTP